MIHVARVIAEIIGWLCLWLLFVLGCIAIYTGFNWNKDGKRKP